MTATSVRLKLTRPARSRGADRYEGQLPTEERETAIYIPQSISREGRQSPFPEFQLTLEPVGPDTLEP